jgi:hypothetical protein
MTPAATPTPLAVHPFANRPQTLAEAVSRTNAGERFDYTLPEFLDVFYRLIRQGDSAAAYAAIEECPPPLADPRLTAYIGGVAEHLCRRWGLERIPAWTDHPSRFLKRPFFEIDEPSVRHLYLKESPLAFRRRLIFVEAVPLRRASMARISR